MTDRSLVSGFLRSVERCPDRPALEIEGEAWSYRQLCDRAASIASGLSGSPLTAVLAYRTVTAFAGVLAALLAGGGFVPLSPRFPVRRTREMLARSGCRHVVVDRRGADQLDDLLAGTTTGLRMHLPDEADPSSFGRRWPQHEFVGVSDESHNRCDVPEVDLASPAYLLFTSGSTGTPKGVAVSHANVRHFLDVVVDRYAITEEDRLTQMFDMTFDLSVFDMFAAWERGACVCCPTTQERNLPGRFITERGITVWFSVPSTGIQMQRLRQLREGQYPGLRLSLFCGEALTADLAEAWALAAPNAVVENLYGPTEATIACTAYRWDAKRSPGEVEQGVVPIGVPLAGTTVRVVDDDLREVPPGETGELVVGGPQVTRGYWKDAVMTARAFVRLPGAQSPSYRTGDRVRRPRTKDEPLRYLGRMDHQIKIQGYRVEVGEVEAAVREEVGVEAAVAVGWPRTVAGASGIVVFLEAEGDLDSGVAERLRRRLPPYMVPREIVSMATLPLNANGKVDRKALVQHLETRG